MKRNSQYSHVEVAKWMFAEFDRNGVLFHDIAVDRIRELFGTEFTYPVEDGYFGIDQDVLREFRRLGDGQIVWVRFQQFWRRRRPDDSQDGQQNPDRTRRKKAL